MSKLVALGCAGVLMTALFPPEPAAAWARAGRYRRLCLRRRRQLGRQGRRGRYRVGR